MPFKLKTGAKRAGFTLIEVVVATLIFGFMLTSLAVVYSTATKHMSQNYRLNTCKSAASVAMKTITSRLQEANRIDAPLPNADGPRLAFAINVDQADQGGCYPINPQAAASWHYFCLLGDKLYYHTSAIAGGGGCPGGAAWGSTYPAFCGPGGGGTVTLLAEYVVPIPAVPLFSRRTNLYSNSLVNINLRIFWDPETNALAGGRDFRRISRTIETTLNTTVRVTCTGSRP